jgi:hypothetical protein
LKCTDVHKNLFELLCTLLKTYVLKHKHVFLYTSRPDTRYSAKDMYAELLNLRLVAGKLGSSSTNGAAVAAVPPIPPATLSVRRCNGLEGGFLMLALLHKRIYKKKRHHQYWVHHLLCTRLETSRLSAILRTNERKT